MMNLICPKDHLPLNEFKCAGGHEYGTFEGIPVLLRDDVPATLWTLTKSLRIVRGEEDVDREINYVSQLVHAAAGSLYTPLVGNLREYPIPDIPLSASGSLLDIGCNWGRWTISASRKGYRVTGIDSSLDALVAATKVCKELGIEAELICADARYLPFPDNSFDQAFSFSVLQHFSKPDARLAFNEMKRVAGKSLVEIPGKYGVRAFYNQLKRGFREPQNFDVRYWAPSELKAIGAITPHAYFGTGVLKCDVKYLPWKYKAIPYASDFLTRLPLGLVADSYWVNF